MFCQNCGASLADGAKFCPECGARVGEVSGTTSSDCQQQRAYTPYQQPNYAGTGQTRFGIPAPGFSDRANDPEILAFIAKSRKIGGKIGFVVALLPLIGFIVYASVTGKMELQQAALYGAGVSAVFFLLQIISSLRERAGNSYEGVVTDKKTRLYDRNKTRDSKSFLQYEYVIHVRTTDGKKKKILEHDGGRVIAYHMLDVGDRFRYHANFAFPYELYDKRKGPGIYCVGCQTLNPIENDRCKKCGIPLLK